MAELFLSYAHQDIKPAETLAQLLEANGLTVWWDRRMVAGDKINDVIDEGWKRRRASLCCGLEFLLSLIGCAAKLQLHTN